MEKQKNKFRGENNTRYLKGLFYEQTLSDKSSVLYTLKDVEHEGYPSLFCLYLECGDPTEYKFATTYLDGWEHWEMLQACTWFEPYIKRWRKELDLKLKSEALARILKKSRQESKDFFAINKFILDKGWVTDGKRGRPSKEEISRRADEILENNTQIKDDYERLVSLGDKR